MQTYPSYTMFPLEKKREEKKNNWEISIPLGVQDKIFFSMFLIPQWYRYCLWRVDHSTNILSINITNTNAKQRHSNFNNMRRLAVFLVLRPEFMVNHRIWFWDILWMRINSFQNQHTLLLALSRIYWQSTHKMGPETNTTS